MDWITFPYTVKLFDKTGLCYHHLVATRADALLITELWKHTQRVQPRATLHTITPAFTQRKDWVTMCRFTKPKTIHMLTAFLRADALLWKQWAEGVGQSNKPPPTSWKVQVIDMYRFYDPKLPF